MELLIENNSLINVPTKVRVEVSVTDYCYCVIIMALIQEEYNCTTALILACENGHIATVELLIHKGANVNYQDKVKELYY